MKKLNLRELRVPIILAAVVLLAVLILTITVSGHRSRSDRAAVEAGITYLEAQEARDPAQVDEILRLRREEQLRQERAQLLEDLSTGRKDVWSMFDDYVLLGDSRAVGFYYYDFLSESRCLAEGGDTIRNVADHLEDIRALNPSYVYLCYGINDVGIGIWETPEEYAAEMLEVVRSVNEVVPHAKVVVSSILPADEVAFEQSDRWRQIPDYNAAVGAACQREGIIYVSNDEISAQHMDLYQPDGIHLQPDFYPIWAANLIMGVLEAGDNENDAA